MFDKLEEWLNKQLKYTIYNGKIKNSVLEMLEEVKHNIETIIFDANDECWIYFKYEFYFELADKEEIFNLIDFLKNMKEYLKDELNLQIMSILCHKKDVWYFQQGKYVETFKYLNDLTKEVKKEFIEMLLYIKSICKLVKFQVLQNIKVNIMNDYIQYVFDFSLYYEPLLRNQMKRVKLELKKCEKYFFVDLLTK